MFSPVIAEQNERCIGSWRCKHREQHRFTGFEVNHRGVLHEPVIGIQHEVGHVRRHINVGRDRDALEHATDQCGGGDDNILKRIKTFAISLAKTPRERREQHEGDEKESLAKPLSHCLAVAVHLLKVYPSLNRFFDEGTGPMNQ